MPLKTNVSNKTDFLFQVDVLRFGILHPLSAGKTHAYFNHVITFYANFKLQLQSSRDTHEISFIIQIE